MPPKGGARSQRNRPRAEASGRAAIVNAVQTPLGFFALVVLVVEALLGATAGVVRGVNAGVVVGAMIALIFLLVLLVAFLAYYRPEALQGKRLREETPALLPDISAAQVEHVEAPAVLCVATADFETLGTDRDIAILSQHFSSKLTVLRNATGNDLRAAFTQAKHGIVHILAYVDAATGTLRLGENDHLGAEGLTRLVEVCGARLVVLASCDSVVLAAKLSHATNMVAAIGSMSDDDFVKWETCFYALLAGGHTLSRAYEVARATTEAPVVLLLRRDFTVGA